MADITLTADFTPLIAALNRNSDMLERVIAGQEKAIPLLEKDRAEKDGKTSRTRKATAAPADEGNAEAAVTESPAVVATAASEPTLPTSADEMKVFCGTLTGAAKDADEKNTFLAFLRDAATKLGGAGTQGLMLDARKSVFWIERKKAGLSVDLDAAYDFDGDPKQDAPAAADDFG